MKCSFRPQNSVIICRERGTIILYYKNATNTTHSCTVWTISMTLIIIIIIIIIIIVIKKPLFLNP